MDGFHSALSFLVLTGKQNFVHDGVGDAPSWIERRSLQRSVAPEGRTLFDTQPRNNALITQVHAFMWEFSYYYE